MKDITTSLNKLRDAGLKWTPQRLAVLESFEGNTSHPSAEMIYQTVKLRYPMISFATVYKTLKVLEKIGEIQQLTIAEDKVHFDPETRSHHHFLCKSCRRIYDVKGEENLLFEEIDGHLVESSQVFLYGDCASCRDSR